MRDCCVPETVEDRSWLPPSRSHRPMPQPRPAPRAAGRRRAHHLPERRQRLHRRPPRPRAAATTRRRRRQGDDRLVTLVGTMADLTPGEAIVAHGWWRNDPKHGWQFTVLDYRTALPATVAGDAPLPRQRAGQGDRPGDGRADRRRLRGGDLRRHRGDARAADRGAGHRQGAGGADRRDLGGAAAHPRGDDGAAGLRGLHLAGGAHLQALRRRQRAGGGGRSRTGWRARCGGSASRRRTRSPQAVGIAADAPERLQAGVLHALGAAGDEGHTLLPEATLVAQAAALLGA